MKYYIYIYDPKLMDEVQSLYFSSKLPSSGTNKAIQEIVLRPMALSYT